MIPAAFPLSWPAGVPRQHGKAASQFKTGLSAALKNVRGSLQLFARDTSKAVTDIVLSSNVGGLEGTPKDTGVAAWFTWDGEQRCIAVDRYPKVEDNLQAIHHIVEARRTEMRHGGLHIVRQTFKGFTALPAPTVTEWRALLGVGPGPATRKAIEAAFRKKASDAHPDHGGDVDRLMTIQAARAAALASLS